MVNCEWDEWSCVLVELGWNITLYKSVSRTDTGFTATWESTIFQTLLKGKERVRWIKCSLFIELAGYAKPHLSLLTIYKESISSPALTSRLRAQ
jgi:hypothetical protein